MNDSNNGFIRDGTFTNTYKTSEQVED